MWVEQGTFLLRRVEEETTFGPAQDPRGEPTGGFRSTSVTDYDPQADVPLSDDDFRFDPGEGVGPGAMEEDDDFV